MLKNLDDIICYDIDAITAEIGIDGIYKTNPVERVYRTKTQTEDIIRVYILNVSYGGVSLIGIKTDPNTEREWKVIMLSEDDGYFFPAENIKFLPSGSKSSVLDMLGRAMSLINNIND